MGYLVPPMPVKIQIYDHTHSIERTKCEWCGCLHVASYDKPKCSQCGGPMLKPEEIRIGSR